MPFFAKSSDLARPSELWVLIDEDERSINDGCFQTDPTARIWFDMPAISAYRHGYSYPLAFADGHSEVWRLTDPQDVSGLQESNRAAGQRRPRPASQRDDGPEVVFDCSHPQALRQLPQSTLVSPSPRPVAAIPLDA